MALHPERTKSKPSIFPVKFKGFVKDARSFTRDPKPESKSEDFGSFIEKPAEAVIEFPPSPTECSTVPLYTANLNVQVSLHFDEPLDFAYSRHYEGSPSLVVTQKLCQGLLHRIDHCSQELLTRKDANALQRTRNNGLGKAVRFELHIQINRESEVWAARTFTSYQKQPVTAEAAREIALETHYMIGLFFLQHDDGFVLKDGPIRDDPSQSPETHAFRSGRVQPISSCVPRSYFLQGSQRFESIPGYTIHLKMTNRNHRRKPAEWQHNVEVNSQQTAPLTLAIAESLFFEAAQSMESILRFERDGFEERHRTCVQPDGCSYWRQHEGDGFELELSIKNNLGPQFEHLRRTVSSKIALLSHLQAGDCDKFAGVLEQAFMVVRDNADEKMNGLNDLEFRIIELRGRGWALEEPLLFTIDPSSTQSRRDTDAVLDRVQAGIADILRRNAMAVRMTAYKRGHLILDKTLVAREPLDPQEGRKKLHKTSKEHVLDRLRARIEKDIGLICKDTCSLGPSEDEVPIPVGTAPKCLPTYEDESANTDDVPVPDGTGSKCLPTHEDESVNTEVRPPVSPSRASVKSTVDQESIKTATPDHPAKSAQNEEPCPPPPSTPSPPAKNVQKEDTYPPSPSTPPPAKSAQNGEPSYLPPPRTPSPPAKSAQNGEPSYFPPPRTPPPPIPHSPLSQQEKAGTIASPLDSPIQEPIKASTDGANEAMEDVFQEREGSSKFSIRTYLSKGRTPFPRLGSRSKTDTGSTAPSTPSLISGEISTPRSSHEVSRHGLKKILGIEPKSRGDPIANSDAHDDSQTSKSIKSSKSSKRFRPNFFSRKTTLPTLKRWMSKHNKTSSPLHEDYTASEGTTAIVAPQDTREPDRLSQDTNLGNRSGIATTTAPTFEASVLPTPYSAVSENPIDKPPNEAPAPAPEPDAGETAEPTTMDSISEYEAALRSLETDVFSQSRLDFDFSSPAACTTMSTPNTPTPGPVNDDHDDDGVSESESLTSPRRLSSHSHKRNSFGSAGFVGFHEQKIVQVSLRRALMGSPKSRGSPTSSGKGTPRPRAES